MSDRNRTENSKNENAREEKLFRAMSGVDEELLLRSEQSGGKNTGKVHKFPVYYATRIGAACLCFVVAGVLYAAVSSTKMADSTGSADTAAPMEHYAAAQAENAGNDGRSGEDMPESAEQAAESAGNGGRNGEDTLGGAMSDMSETAVKVPESGMYEAATALPEGASSEVSDGAKKEAASVLSEEAAAEVPNGTMDGTMPVSSEEAAAGLSESAAEDAAPEGAAAGSVVEGNVQQAAQGSDVGMQDSQMSAAGADSCCDGGMAETGTEAVAQEVMEKQGRHLPGKMTRKGQ